MAPPASVADNARPGTTRIRFVNHSPEEETDADADFAGTDAGLTGIGPPPSVLPPRPATKIVQTADAHKYKPSGSATDGDGLPWTTRHRWPLVAAAALVALVVAVLVAVLSAGGNGDAGGAELATNGSFAA